MWLRISLTALTPLSFRAGRNPARSTTLPYVPGTSLLGGLAQAHQDMGRDPDEFAAFFLQDRMHFGNCYPADFTARQLRGDAHPVHPVPLTARTCKRFGGFKFYAKEDGDNRRGVTDALIPLALFALSGEAEPELLKDLDTHPDSGQPLDVVRGFFRRGLRADHIGQPSQKSALRPHTGINYDTGTVQPAVLYNRHVLPEGSQFWGRWWLDDTLWEVFEQFITELAEYDNLRLGNNRTRGLGLVRFNASRMDGDTTPDLRTRVEAFTARFKHAATRAGLAAPATLYVPLLCTSDVILYDPLLRARLQIHGADVAAAGLRDAVMVFHAASTAQVQSWSSLWGLPKADDWAIGMGSVFLFVLSHADETIFSALENIEHHGLGARRSEGFGMVSVAHPFHVELAGEYR